MTVEVVVPADFQGEAVGQISRRNGVITGTDESEGWFTINAEVTL